MEHINPTTIDEYINLYNPEIKTLLKLFRQAITEAAPLATEKISWGMATFIYHGNLAHFAGQKKHIGFYPSPSAIEAFKDELMDYHCSKGTVQFSYDKPIPFELVKKMVQYRVKEQETLMEKKIITKDEKKKTTKKSTKDNN